MQGLRERLVILELVRLDCLWIIVMNIAGGWTGYHSGGIWERQGRSYAYSYVGSLEVMRVIQAVSTSGGWCE